MSELHDLRDTYFPGTEVLLPNEMRITALGTGRPFLRMAQANAGWFIELGNGDCFVFDFGCGSFSRFTALELPISRITAMFASHLHTDHVGDFGAYWVGARAGGRLAPLDMYGPSGSIPEHGFAHFVKCQVMSYQWDKDTRRGLLPLAGEEVNVHEFDWSKNHVVYEANGVSISSFPAVHIHDGAVGLRLDWRGMSFVYSGDTAPSQFLVDAAQGADVLVHECFNSMPQLMRKSGYGVKTAKGIGHWAHTQPRDAGQVFDLVRPGLAVPFHFNNDFDTVIELSDEIRESYDGDLALADDLMVINLRPGEHRVRMAVASSRTWPNKDDHSGFENAERGDRAAMSDWLRAGRLDFGEPQVPARA